MYLSYATIISLHAFSENQINLVLCVCFGCCCECVTELIKRYKLQYDWYMGRCNHNSLRAFHDGDSKRNL